MAIFNLQPETAPKKETESKDTHAEILEQPFLVDQKKNDSIFSLLVTRFFFFLLLIADLVWGAYALLLLTISVAGGLLTAFHSPFFRSLWVKGFLMLKRCLVCALSLFVGLFSPAFGIMVACTYFLMYDKSGIEEVIPTSLQDQFKDLFKGKDESI
jgi:hypothetical protein